MHDLPTLKKNICLILNTLRETNTLESNLDPTLKVAKKFLSQNMILGPYRMNDGNYYMG
jgi:hypothetical protein